MSAITFDNHQNKCRCCFQQLSIYKASLWSYKHLLETVVGSELSSDLRASVFLCSSCVLILEQYEQFMSRTKLLQDSYNEFLQSQVPDRITVKSELVENEIWLSSADNHEPEEKIDIPEYQSPIVIKSEVQDFMECVVKIEPLDPKILNAIETIETKPEPHSSKEIIKKFTTPSPKAQTLSTRRKYNCKKVKQTKPEKQTCSYCNFKCYKESFMKKHIEWKHEKVVMFCDLCDFTCQWRCQMKIHMEAKHASKDTYKCTLCRFTTGESAKMRFHVKQHDMPIQLTMCSICGKTFKLSKSYKYHMSIHEMEQAGEQIVHKRKKTLTLIEKKALLAAYYDPKGKYYKKTAKAIAMREDVSESTIIRILHKKDVILATETSAKRKQFRTRKTEDLEMYLSQWVVDVRQKRIPLRGSFIRDQALKYNEVYKVPNFKAKHSWYRYFTKKIKLPLSRRVGNPDDMEAATRWLNGKLKNLLSYYHPDDIYNLDEFVLFVDALPRKGRDVEGKEFNECRDTKRRVTLALCANMSGSDKRPVHMITTHAQQQSMSTSSFNAPLRVRTDSSTNGWMTKSIFMRWLKDWNEELKAQERQIVLVMDSCSSHGCVDDEEFEMLKNIKIEFLPPNLITLVSGVHPLDSGVISLIKHKYRTQMLHRVSYQQSEINQIDERLKFFSLSNQEVMHLKTQRKKLSNIGLFEFQALIDECWREISPNSIEKAFRKAGWRVELVNGDNSAFSSYHDETYADEAVNQFFCEIDEMLINRHIKLEELNEEIHLDEVVLKEYTNAEVAPLETQGVDVNETEELPQLSMSTKSPSTTPKKKRRRRNDNMSMQFFKSCESSNDEFC